MWGADIDYGDKFTLIAAVVVLVLGVGRMTRLIVADTYPPSVWLRERWIWLTRNREHEEAGEWSKLVTCWWCASPYIAVVAMFWGWASSLHWTWWVFWGWLAVSYLASMIVERDDRPDRADD